MRILITSLPGHGHLGPLIPLARTLSQREHDVRVATSETFRETLEAHGLRLTKCGPLWRESDFGRNFRQPHLLADLGEFISKEVNPQVQADVAEHVRRERPDLILSNDFEPNGRLVAEREGIPFVLVSSGPRLPRAVRERIQGGILRTARRTAGLAEEGVLDYTLRWLVLRFSPSEHVYCDDAEVAPAVPSNELGIRPSVVEFGARYRVDKPEPHEGSRPRVLCTFGTVFNKDPEIFRMIIGAIAPRASRLLILLGAGLDDSSLGPLPANVELCSNTMLSTMLPHVDYAVTHGGTATLAAIQLRGIPCLLMPLGADQIINAAACRRSRVGVVRYHTMAAMTVHTSPVPMTEASIGEAFDELTANPDYRTRAAAFGRSLRVLPGLGIAAERLERLAATR
jgi:UDP:flavonoid glycosyltransferase YjiC (YdhE family)